jgi:hypothetical protein
MTDRRRNRGASVKPQGAEEKVFCRKAGVAPDLIRCESTPRGAMTHMDGGLSMPSHTKRGP